MSLAVATLGLAVAIQSLVFDNDRISGGRNGVRLSLNGSLRLFGLDVGSFSHPERYAFVVLLVALVLGSAVAAIRRGASGRRMIAVRNNERAAAGLGIDVVMTKLWAFGLASAIAGVAGVLTAFRGPAALFSQQSVLSNIVSVGYAVVGGVGSVIGALFGSTLEPGGAGNEALGWIVGVGPVTMSLIGGVLLIVTIVGSPDGMGPAASNATRRLPTRRRAAVAARRLERFLATGPVGSVGVRPAALRLQGVGVRFGAVQAVADVDLSVAPGEIVGVVGANGAGKTTLIDAATGFVPSSGRIEIGIEDIGSRAAHRRARLGVGRSWQSIELIEDLTVLDNLRASADVHRWWSVLADLVRPRRDRPTGTMLRAIDALHLCDHLAAMPGELSTGQRKLVALARAIVSEPSVILLDEPCSGLDQDERDEVGAVVRMLAREWGMGVLLVEHDVQLVRRLSDRIVALDAGRVVAEGSADDVLGDPRVIAAFLGEAADPGPGGGNVSGGRGDPVSSGAPVLEARGLHAGYGDVTVVRDLDLEVRAGEIVALLGRNGAGKTTSLLTLAGALRPQAGEILLRGRPDRSSLPGRVRQGAGLMTDDRSILFGLTVRENLRLARGSRDVPSMFPELERMLDRRAGLLSGGQQQMLGLAAVLSREPEVLLVDELSFGLAPLIVQRLMRALREAAEAGTAVIMVEQFARLALDTADRACVLVNGHLALSGSTSELRADLGELERSYLGAH